MFAGWSRLGYLRGTTARAAPPYRVAPAALTPHADVWHEFTRVSHVLIHQPSGTHAHLLGNVALILVAAWALLAALTMLDRRPSFSTLYGILVIVAPVVGSFAFDRFGQTPHGYGASTVGFAFLGVAATISAFALYRWTREKETTQSLRGDGCTEASPLVVVTALVFATVVIVADVVVGSPAMPVHQAGVGFGVTLGVVMVSLGD